MVIGVGGFSPGITDLGPDHSWNTPEPGVDTPESPQGKQSEFRFLGGNPVD